MNTPVRRVAIAVLVLFGLLIANANYVQVIRADQLKGDQSNRRTILDEYERQRGDIVVDGKAIATSKSTTDRLRFLRQYPQKDLYAQATGFYSLIYGRTGVEAAENPILSGTDDRLFTQRLTDLFYGRDPKGGQVVLTLNDKAQRAAYEGLDGRPGAVVALDPKTGAILAMVSGPSYDPNLLSSHDTRKIRSSYQQYLTDPKNPMLNRALNQSYPPGSVFKIIDSAAALKDGFKPEDRIPAPDALRLPQSTSVLRNFGGERCGDGQTDTLLHALTISCNTAFAQLALTLGEQKIRDQAAAFGITDQGFSNPLRVSPSSIGPIEDGAALAQSAIGQRDVRLTPLQGAMLAAAVANRGTLMAPYLVKEVRAPDFTVLGSTQPHELSQAMPPEVAAQLSTMMESVVANGTGRTARIDGVKVAGKTGTAENSEDKQPHAWFVGFAAPNDDPRVAVAVIIENGGTHGNEVTGGQAAGPIAKAVMQAVLGGR